MDPAGGPDPQYPREREADIVLRDGSTLRVRPVRASDAPSIRAFLDAISPESITFRFFGIPNLEWVTSWAVDVDYRDRFALVAETGDPARTVAHAAYIRSAPERAEVAFLVADEFQGHGIATTLLAHLASVAENEGIATFTAEVMPANRRMIETFRESGFPVQLHYSTDSLVIELPTSVTTETRARLDERERIASVAAVRSVLEPRVVAVVGASRTRGTIGREVLHNILGSGFTGRVYPVNPAADEIHGLPAYPSVGAIADAVDLAVIVVPSAQVIDVARDCAAAGVRTLVVISSGFAETGPQGAAQQAELLNICRSAGIRVVGPNCLGVINTDPAVRLNATFATRPPLPGSVGFMSQSGGLGIAIIEAASRLGLGLSSFVAVGNKSDISGNDMLRYWEQDPHTRVALLYLESFGNPRKFARATGSHTGVLLAQSDLTIDALFEQAGVIRTDTLHELFAVAQLLTTQPVPRGDRVAIVSNAGGPGIMCADACQADGVDVPELSADLQAQLAELLPPGSSVANPIDMLAGCSPADYGSAMRTLLQADACDAILTIFVPSLTASAEAVARVVRAVAAESPTTAIAAVFMTEDAPPQALRSGSTQVPGYEFPEDAARAVALAAKHGRWRARPEPPRVVLDEVAPQQGAALIADALGADGGWMTAAQVTALLGCYGLACSAQSMPPAAVELVVGVVNDPNFGPVLACGPGGAAGELMHDLAVRLTPLSVLDAHELPRALRTFPLLDGYQGAPRCDVASLEQVLLRISAMVENHAEITELECAPVYVSPAGTAIASARIRLAVTAPPPPVPSLLSY